MVSVLCGLSVCHEYLVKEIQSLEPCQALLLITFLSIQSKQYTHSPGHLSFHLKTKGRNSPIPSCNNSLFKMDSLLVFFFFQSPSPSPHSSVMPYKRRKSSTHTLPCSAFLQDPLEWQEMPEISFTNSYDPSVSMLY